MALTKSTSNTCRRSSRKIPTAYGLSDDFETLHSGDPLAMDAMSDLDGDRLTALAEYLSDTSP